MSPRPWRIYRRANTKGRNVYTGLFRDVATGKEVPRTLYNLDGTNCTNRSDAEAAALRLMDAEHARITLTVSHAMLSEITRAAADAKQTQEAYLLSLHTARMATQAGELLADYLEAFWAPGSAYIRAKEAARAPLSAVYVNNSRSAVSKHIAPWFRRTQPELTLQGTGPAHLEALKQHLVDSGLGPSRVNGIIKAARVALGEAWRLEAIPVNPASKVHKLPDPAPKREIFSMEEAKRFFAVEQDERYKIMYLTAALAGLRLGEIRGLQVGDIMETTEKVMDKRGRAVEAKAYILHVCHNWQDWEEEGHKMKGPKHSTLVNVRARDVPIPERLALALRYVAGRTPYGDGFVFWGAQAGAPPSTVIVSQHYREVCAAIGIGEKERKRRGLTFHAWRHWYNTHMRPHLPDYQLRMLTGHTSEAMTDRYTEITDEQRAAVGRVASGLLE